jgi:predicted nucleotidyltransferase
MRRDEIVGILREHRPELEKAGARHLYLFGSVSRDEAREDSDVDMFVDCEKGTFSLFDLMDLRDIASNILGRRVDVTTRGSIHPALRPQIEASALRIY